MGTPYVGEIRMFAGNFAPVGWMLCQGQSLPIAGNETLFNLIGTTYGGDGVNTFNLPDLQSRVPVHAGTGAGQTFVLAQTGGEESVTLTVQQIPAHNHTPQCFSNAQGGNSNVPTGSVWAASTIGSVYDSPPPSLNMDPAAVGSSGGSQPHDNMVPFLVINFIISLFGIFPSPV
jgi:microcystin-dependent protein